MKKVLFFLASVLILVSCENFYIDQNLGGNDYNPTDVRTIDYTLTDADYKSITSYRDNIARAIGLCVSDSIPYTDFLPVADLLLDAKKKVTFEDVKDSLGIADATPYYAFAQIATDLAFNKVALADMYVPAFLTANFPQFSKGSLFNITYKNSEGAPEYLSTFAATSKYTLSTSDYDAIWGEGKEGTYYLTPATMKQLTSVLPTEAEEGAILAVVYEYKDTEPVFGKVEEEEEELGFFNGTPESRGFYTPTEVIAGYADGSIVDGDSIKVGGIVNRWWSYSLNLTYKNLSWFITDGTSEFEMYNAFSVDKDSIVAYDYIDEYTATATDASGRSFTTGDTMVCVGEFTYYAKNDVYEFKKGGYIVELRPAVAAPAAPKKAATVANGKKTALYQYSNGNWNAYKNDAATVVALPEDVYAAVGKDGYISEKNEHVLTTFLAQEYPYAQAGQAYTVVYMNTNSTYKAIEYLYDGAAFVKNLGISIVTTAFSLSDVWGSSIYYKQAIIGEGQGKLVIQDIETGGLSYIWKYDDRYGMKASGFKDKAYNTESWLITPCIDLSRANSPKLSFDQARNYGIDFIKECFVMVSTDYAGDVTQCTWDSIPFNKDAEGNYIIPAADWKFVNTGEMDLTSYVGKKVYIGFVYTSTEDGAATWEIKNLLVAESEE